MKEFAEFIGELLYYVVVALMTMAFCAILICIILLALKGCLVLLGEITPMIGVY